MCNNNICYILFGVNNCWLMYYKHNGLNIFHGDVIFSQLNRVLFQYIFTLDTNDVLQNAKGHRMMEGQMRKKGK